MNHGRFSPQASTINPQRRIAPRAQACARSIESTIAPNDLLLSSLYFIGYYHIFPTAIR